MREKIRESNIELLRIFAMMMIVAYHSVRHNLTYIQGTEIHQGIGAVLLGIGQLGVTVFVLISGYFQIDKEFKTKRVVRVYLQLLFYSISMMIICTVFRFAEFNKLAIIRAFLPVSYNEYWFFSAYIILCVLTPFLNKFAKSLEKENYKKMLIIFTVIFSVIYSLLYSSRSYSVGDGNLGAVAWFIYLYLLAGYIKLYKINILENKKTLYILTITVFIIFATLLIFLNQTRNHTAFYWYVKINSIFILTLAVSVFHIFKNAKIKQSKIINYIASLAFPVYIIHENYLFRETFWSISNKIVPISSNTVTSTILNILCSIFAVFIMAAVAETIRRFIEKQIFKSKKVNELLEKSDKIIN